jgi:hypothetical protein
MYRTEPVVAGIVDPLAGVRPRQDRWLAAIVRQRLGNGLDVGRVHGSSSGGWRPCWSARWHFELGPIRVNAASPGTIDSGAWDALGGQGKADFFAATREHNPAKRIGTTDDVANAVLFALTSSFLTGQTLHIDGGEPLT